MSAVVGRIMRGWVRARMADRPPLIVPGDDPVVRVDGPDGVRALLVGSGPAAGVGVRTHALGLTGALARAVAARTGCGAVVEGIGRPDLELREVAGLLDGVRLDRVDAVVLVAGTMEAMTLTAPGQWARELRSAIGALRAGPAAAATVVVAGMPPITSIGAGSGWRGRVADRSAARLNAASAAVATAEGVAFAPLSAPASMSALPSAAWYTDWSAELAPLVVAGRARCAPPSPV